jgi:hypothetical protein
MNSYLQSRLLSGTGSTKVFRFCLLLCFTSPVVFAQRRNSPLEDFAIERFAEWVGNSVSDAVDAAGRYSKQVGELNQELSQARALYWNQYPNGPQYAAASKRFRGLLFEKDLILLNQALLTIPVNHGGQKVNVEILGLLGGPVDGGGIRPVARVHFGTWASLIRKLMGRGGRTMEIWDFPDRLIKALNDSWPAYRSYVLARDYAEFTAAGKLPGGGNSEMAYLQLLVLLDATERLYDIDIAPPANLFDDAVTYSTAQLSDWATIFGSEAIRMATRRVMAAPKDDKGRILDVEHLGLILREISSTALLPEGKALTGGSWPLDMILGLLQARGPKEFMIGTLLPQKVFGLDRTWARALLEWSSIESAYGSQNAIAAASEIFRAKKYRDGSLVEPQESVRMAFFTALAKRNPIGFVRKLIAERLNIHDPVQVDAAYEKLKARYPEPKISEAARRLLQVRTMNREARSAAFPNWSPYQYHMGTLDDLIDILRGRLDAVFGPIASFGSKRSDLRNCA